MAVVNLGTGCKPGPDAVLRLEVAGAAILIGQLVYRDPADGKCKLASTASLIASSAVGVAMTSATAADQPVVVQWDGTVTGTATLVRGDGYWVSDTAGSVGQQADITTNDWVCFVGAATLTTALRLAIKPFEMQHA